MDQPCLRVKKVEAIGHLQQPMLDLQLCSKPARGGGGWGMGWGWGAVFGELGTDCGTLQQPVLDLQLCSTAERAMAVQKGNKRLGEAARRACPHAALHCAKRAALQAMNREQQQPSAMLQPAQHPHPAQTLPPTQPTHPPT